MNPATRLRWLANLWPPFLFAGIRVLEIDPEFRTVRVVLRHRFFNRNYVGTHFGGSLFSMADPFWMILLIHRLGPGYTVWDKSAAIDFRKAVREAVYVKFLLADEVVDEIREATRDGTPVTRWFVADITTADGTVVATVRKEVHVRLRQRRAAAPGSS